MQEFRGSWQQQPRPRLSRDAEPAEALRPKKIQEAADCCSQEQLPECIICGRSSKRGGTVPVPLPVLMRAFEGLMQDICVVFFLGTRF